MKTLLLTLLLTLPAFAETARELESRVQTSLNQTLQRILPEGKFLAQVSAIGDTRMEREMVEGESITSNAKSPTFNVLPGFTPPKVDNSANSGTTRQTFRAREKFELQKIAVQLLVDESVSSDLVAQAEELSKNYLAVEFGAKAQVTTAKATLQTPTVRMNWGPALPWALAALFAGVAIATYLWGRKNIEPHLSSPETMRGLVPEVLEKEQLPGRPAATALPAPNTPMANLTPLGTLGLGESDGSPAGFPPLPATAEFSDRRAELLEAFLQNAEIFRMYFMKLSEGSRAELYSGLRGPAFDSLLETLSLLVPLDGIPALSPSEDQIAFYLKNFQEFLKSFEWQEKQFFGFLHSLEDAQVIKIVQQQNPLLAAVILNFIGPDRSAKILDSLPRERRVECLAQLERSRDLPLSELREIERVVRESAAEMPRLSTFQQNLDLRYWSRLLSRAENQDEILLDLEQVMPSLYPKLAKYRFKLEDLPMLPKSLLLRILDQVDNEQLGAALVGVELSLQEFVLQELSQERRALVENFILVNQGMPPATIDEHVMSLTKRFREVMA